MEIEMIPHDFSICKVADYSLVKLDSEYSFIGKTDEEKSLVCITSNVPSNAIEREDGWKAFRIQGILDFSLLGILSEISGILAENKIGIFVISTFNTDYVLTKKENYRKALKVLGDAGYNLVLSGCQIENGNWRIGMEEKNLEQIKKLINRIADTYDLPTEEQVEEMRKLTGIDWEAEDLQMLCCEYQGRKRIGHKNERRT